MSKHHTKTRVYGRRRKAWRPALLISLGALVFAALMLGLYWMGQGANRSALTSGGFVAGAATASTLAAHDRAGGQSPLQAVLRKHLAASNLAATRSLAISGRYRTAGATLELEIQTKRPNLHRQVLSTGDLRILHAYDGERAWQENPLLRGEDHSELLDALNERILILECAHAALPWHYDAHGIEDLELLPGEHAVRGHDCNVIENTALLDTPTFHYIDSKTGLELRRTATIPVDGNDYEVVIDYQSPAFADDPTGGASGEGYQLYVNDRLVAEATFQSKRTNPGLMSWMFDQRPGL